MAVCNGERTMKKRLAIATAAIVFGAAPLAYAQYAGPSSAKQAAARASFATVAEILKNPVDDVQVTLEGHLVRQVGKEKYLFTDGTGEIRVEIDTEDFPAARIDDKTKIKLQGEVEKDFMQSPEIDVKQIAPAT
jgi:uncharacterized protein (TIGR00156 family)